MNEVRARGGASRARQSRTDSGGAGSDSCPRLAPSAAARAPVSALREGGRAAPRADRAAVRGALESVEGVLGVGLGRRRTPRRLGRSVLPNHAPVRSPSSPRCFLPSTAPDHLGPRASAPANHLGRAASATSGGAGRALWRRRPAADGPCAGTPAVRLLELLSGASMADRRSACMAGGAWRSPRPRADLGVEPRLGPPWTCGGVPRNVTDILALPAPRARDPPPPGGGLPRSLRVRAPFLRPRHPTRPRPLPRRLPVRRARAPPAHLRQRQRVRGRNRRRGMGTSPSPISTSWPH